jgi:uncharacterized protein
MIDLDSARYVALTTFKKDGTPVATPVWITGSEGTYAFTTGDNAWKSKRLNNNPKVTVQVSDFRGRVRPNTRVYTGAGRVDPTAEGIAAVEQALAKKYSWQFKLTQLTDVIKDKLGKSVKQHAVAIHLDIDVS